MPLTVNGWTILFHDMMIGQVKNLADAVEKAKAANPDGDRCGRLHRSNANYRVFAAIAKLVLKTIPGDPANLNYRIGNTMGKAYRHWSRAKFGQRFRLFFRYHSKAKIIVFAWVNDSSTLRTAGARNDPYEVFKGMLDRKNPPDDWDALVETAQDLPAQVLKGLATAGAEPAEPK